MRERIELSGCLFIVDPADRGTLKGSFFALQRGGWVDLGEENEIRW